MKRAGSMCIVRALCVLGVAPFAHGEELHLQLLNGTTGGEALAEKVVVFELSAGMVPILELANVASGTTLPIETTASSRRMLLVQVAYQGVNYNVPVPPGPIQSALSVEVFESTSARDESLFAVSSVQFALRRSADRITLEKEFLIQNRSDPPRSFVDPDEGSFLFHLPDSDDGLIEVRHLTATGATGVPVPQPSFAVKGSDGVHATRTAFKPGETRMSVSYELRVEGTFRFSETALYPYDEVVAIVEPSDVVIESSEWKELPATESSRFVSLSRVFVPEGERLELELATTAAPADEAGGSGLFESNMPRASHAIVELPDKTMAYEWAVALLMGVVLAFGLARSIRGGAG